MTQADVLNLARANKPNVRYAGSKDGNAVGAYVPDLGRFVIVASRTVAGDWVALSYELLVNGQPPYTPDDWNEGGAA